MLPTCWDTKENTQYSKRKVCTVHSLELTITQMHLQPLPAVLGTSRSIHRFLSILFLILEIKSKLERTLIPLNFSKHIIQRRETFFKPRVKTEKTIYTCQFRTENNLYKFL